MSDFECPYCHQSSMLEGLCSTCIKSRRYVRVRPRESGEVKTLAEAGADDLPRIQIPGFPLMDDALNGGFVRGSSMLMHGGPGSGKTTIGLQIAERVSRLTHPLYVTTEQMLSHVNARAVELGLQTDMIHAVATTDYQMIESAVVVIEPGVVIVDSLQNVNVYSDYAGSRIVAACTLLTELARAHNCAVIIVCHETKDDTFAGPRTLEHIVDGIISMTPVELRAGYVKWRIYSKYRFGPVPRHVILGREPNGRFFEDDTQGVRTGSVDSGTSA